MVSRHSNKCSSRLYIKSEHQNKYSILMMIIEVGVGIRKCTRVYALRGILSESLTCDKPVARHSIPAKVHSLFNIYKLYFNVIFTKKQEIFVSLLQYKYITVISVLSVLVRFSGIIASTCLHAVCL